MQGLYLSGLKNIYLRHALFYDLVKLKERQQFLQYARISWDSVVVILFVFHVMHANGVCVAREISAHTLTHYQHARRRRRARTRTRRDE